jgi:predicted RNA-binding Zn-ribbon protein involved in translation (DUF1610 family)
MSKLYRLRFWDEKTDTYVDVTSETDEPKICPFCKEGNDQFQIDRKEVSFHCLNCGKKGTIWFPLFDTK